MAKSNTVTSKASIPSNVSARAELVTALRSGYKAYAHYAQANDAVLGEVWSAINFQTSPEKQGVTQTQFDAIKEERDTLRVALNWLEDKEFTSVWFQCKQHSAGGKARAAIKAEQVEVKTAKIESGNPTAKSANNADLNTIVGIRTQLNQLLAAMNVYADVDGMAECTNYPQAIAFLEGAIKAIAKA